LRFISLSLRRTPSTPRDTKFARLELELFTLPCSLATFYDFITGVLLQKMGGKDKQKREGPALTG